MARLGALLAILGCGGVMVIAYLLCSQQAKPAFDAMVAGEVNLLAVGIALSLAADVAGAVLLAWTTRPGRPLRDGEAAAFLDHRPPWATLILVLAVLVPVSVALWFGLLCRLL